MRRSIPTILVIGLLAALLVSCGQSATVQQTGGTPTASSHAHTDQIAWQGFLDLDQSTSAIFSANADGSEARQLTHPSHGEQDGFPDWSPDGKQILFTRNHLMGQSYEDQALFIVNRDGTGLKQVTAWGQLEAGNAHWSPDGQRILFQSFGAFPAGSTPQLYTIFPDGTHLVQVTSKERNSWPAWSPEGTKIIFGHRSTTAVDQNAHLYEMNVDGSGLVQVTKNDFWQLQPAWGIHP